MNLSLFTNKTYTRNEIKGLIESILFVNGKSVETNYLKKIFDFTEDELTNIINEINKDYEERSSGIRIIQVANGFQMVSSPQYHKELKEIFGKGNENILPKSVLETLAIIAYKQPISKEEIDKIRGVSSSRSINILLSQKLITISGSTNDVIKSPLYSTTDKFLELFKLKDINDLPSINNLNFLELETFEDNNDENSNIENEEDNNNELLFNN